MAIFSLVGLFIGAFGLWMISRTLIETRKAATAANTTLKIAQKSHNETVASNRRSQRAYLAVERAFVVTFRDDEPIELEIIVQNFGTTPAIINGRNDVCDIIKAVGEQATSPEVETGFTDIISPTGKRHFKIKTTFNLRAQQHAEIISGDLMCFGMIRLQYEDVFSVTREFEFMGIVSPDAIRKNASLNYCGAHEIKVQG